MNVCYIYKAMELMLIAITSYKLKSNSTTLFDIHRFKCNCSITMCLGFILHQASWVGEMELDSR